MAATEPDLRDPPSSKPAAPSRAHAAKVRMSAVQRSDGGPLDAAHGRNVAANCRASLGLRHVAQRRSSRARSVGWIIAEATVITPDQNLGILSSKPACGANPPSSPRTNSPTSSPKRLCGHTAWTTASRISLRRGCLFRSLYRKRRVGNAPRFFFFSKYVSLVWRCGRGPEHSEIDVVFYADHRATLTKKPFPVPRMTGGVQDLRRDASVAALGQRCAAHRRGAV